MSLTQEVVGKLSIKAGLVQAVYQHPACHGFPSISRPFPPVVFMISPCRDFMQSARRVAGEHPRQCVPSISERDAPAMYPPLAEPLSIMCIELRNEGKRVSTIMRDSRVRSLRLEWYLPVRLQKGRTQLTRSDRKAP